MASTPASMAPWNGGRYISYCVRSSMSALTKFRFVSWLLSMKCLAVAMTPCVGSSKCQQRRWVRVALNTGTSKDTATHLRLNALDGGPHQRLAEIRIFTREVLEVATVDRDACQAQSRTQLHVGACEATSGRLSRFATPNLGNNHA